MPYPSRFPIKKPQTAPGPMLPAGLRRKSEVNLAVYRSHRLEPLQVQSLYPILKKSFTNCKLFLHQKQENVEKNRATY
jgi:hypothetical protein